MTFISFILNIFIATNISQDPCEDISIEKVVENTDLVAIVSLSKMNEDLPDSIRLFEVHKVFKGRAKDRFIITSPKYAFEKDTKYLIFGREIDYLRFSLDDPFEGCQLTNKLRDVHKEIIDFLDERWVSKCYSQEQKDEMKGKAITRELQLFCGCDGKTYENFGHLLSSGITQYIPGECK